MAKAVSLFMRSGFRERSGRVKKAPVVADGEAVYVSFAILDRLPKKDAAVVSLFFIDAGYDPVKLQREVRLLK